jgi:hypothetical protein
MVVGAPQDKKDPEFNPEDFSVVETLKDPSPQIKAGLETITKNDCKSLLTFLSADVLEGRQVASRGYDIATEFAAALFAKAGAKPAGDLPRKTGRRSYMPDPKKKGKKVRSYFQDFPMKEILGSDGRIVVTHKSGAITKTRTFSPDVDYKFYARDSHTLEAPVVFVGYGISEKKLKFDEYKGIDVKGKIVMMLSETPGKGDENSPFQKGDLKKKYYPQRRMRRRSNPKVKLAKKKGAVAVIIVENSPEENGDIANLVIDSQKKNDERPIYPEGRRRLSLIEAGTAMPWETLPSIYISRQMADQMLEMSGGKSIQTVKNKIEKDMKPRSTTLRGVSLKLKSVAKTKLVRSRNVLAYFEGSDPELKDEVVVIGAHLDHLGKKGDYIFNGADDNGSGSIAILELAEAIATGKIEHKRSILLALWTGEESGLLGSRYYVSNPFFPLKKTAAYINLDMVSRPWTEKSFKRATKMWGMKIPKEMMEKVKIDNFISVSYAADAKQAFSALKDNNPFVGLDLYLRKSKGSFGGSDHAPFAMKKIPWIGFFASMHDDYHKPSDTVDKVNFDFMVKITRLTYLAALHLANQ